MSLNVGFGTPARYGRKFVLTQGNVAATDILFRAAVRTSAIMVLDVLTTGPDDYGVGGRTVTVRVTDSAGNVVEHLGDLASVDNQRVHWSPRSDGAPAAANTARRSGGEWLIYGSDRVEVLVASAAQNETLTVQFRARTTGLLSFTSPNAGVSMVETEV